MRFGLLLPDDPAGGGLVVIAEPARVRHEPRVAAADDYGVGESIKEWGDEPEP